MHSGALRSALNYYRAAFRDRANAAMLPGPLRRFFYGDEPLPPPRRTLADWPTIAAPTLLIWGEQDVALGKELTVGMEPLFSGPFEVRYIPDSGHWVQQEQPALVNRGSRSSSASVHVMDNRALARVLRDLAAYLEMDEVQFKPRAYEKAAEAVEAEDRPLAEVYAQHGSKGLRAVPGVGASMAQKLEELLTTGRCGLHEEYRARLPVDIPGLTALEGIGPKAVRILYETLGVRTIEDLAAAARAGKIRALARFGERSEQNILRALTTVAASGGRHLLATVLPVVEDLARRLAAIPGVARRP